MPKKTSLQTRNRGALSQLDNTNKNPTIDIILNSDKLSTFPYDWVQGKDHIQHIIIGPG